MFDLTNNCPVSPTYKTRTDIVIDLDKMGFNHLNPQNKLSYLLPLSKSNEEIVTIIKQIGEYYKANLKPTIECDGLVLASNQFVQKAIISNALNVQNGLAAYKGSVWSENYYIAEIEEFYFNFSNKELPLMARVKSIKTDFGSIIENVPLYNPSTVYYDKLNVGSKIVIEYFSNQIVKYLGPYKEKI